MNSGRVGRVMYSTENNKQIQTNTSDTNTYTGSIHKSHITSPLTSNITNINGKYMVEKSSYNVADIHVGVGGE